MNKSWADHPGPAHLGTSRSTRYFFLLDALVEGRVDCWEATRGLWVPDFWTVLEEAWEGARLVSLLVLTGLPAGVCASAEGVKALARDADRSRARILSSACFSSPSAWIARSSAVWALSSVSLRA